MSTTPPSLLARLRSPDAEAAWTTFIALYAPLLFHWARQTGLREEDAADLVQDVFALLVRKLPEFEYDPHKGGFRKWLRTVLLNKWRENLRRRALPTLEGSEAALEGVATPADPAPFWEVDYRQQLTRRLLQIMQTEFEPATWKACWECVVEGRTTADVGLELGLSPGAVRVAKFRVLSRLRRELDGMFD